MILNKVKDEFIISHYLSGALLHAMQLDMATLASWGAALASAPTNSQLQRSTMADATHRALEIPTSPAVAIG